MFAAFVGVFSQFPQTFLFEFGLFQLGEFSKSLFFSVLGFVLATELLEFSEFPSFPS